MQEFGVHADTLRAVIKNTNVTLVEEMLPADIQLNIGIQHITDRRGLPMHAEIGRAQMSIGVTLSQLTTDDPRSIGDGGAEMLAGCFAHREDIIGVECIGIALAVCATERQLPIVIESVIGLRPETPIR